MRYSGYMKGSSHFIPGKASHVCGSLRSGFDRLETRRALEAKLGDCALAPDGNVVGGEQEG